MHPRAGNWAWAARRAVSTWRPGSRSPARGCRDHRVEDRVASFGHAVDVGVRIERRTRLHHAAASRLASDSGPSRRPEVRLCGVLHAERAVSERDEVEIAREDLVLGQLLVEGEGIRISRILRAGVVSIAARRSASFRATTRVGSSSRTAGRWSMRPAGPHRWWCWSSPRAACPASRRRDGRRSVCPRSRRSRASSRWRSGRSGLRSAAVRTATRWGSRRRRSSSRPRDSALDEFGGDVVDGVGGAVGCEAEASCQRKHRSSEQNTGECGTSRELGDRFGSRHAVQTTSNGPCALVDDSNGPVGSR